MYCKALQESLFNTELIYDYTKINNLTEIDFLIVLLLLKFNQLKIDYLPK